MSESDVSVFVVTHHKKDEYFEVLRAFTHRHDADEFCCRLTAKIARGSNVSVVEVKLYPSLEEAR